MIEFERTDDPLLRDVPLEHRVQLPVLGIPVAYRTNSPDVLAVIEESYGVWRVLEDRPQLLDTDPVQVTVIVYDDAEDVSRGDRTATQGREGDASEHLHVQYRTPDVERVYVTARGCMGVTDTRRREAIAYVTPALVSDREHFRYTFISALTMGLLSPLDRQPLHAAALVRGETALLLAGPSGTGKSTLCYAGALNGLSVLSDDYVNLQRHPHPRVWGMPDHLYLPLDAREHFPALAQHRARFLHTGKEKIAINLREMGAEAPLPVVERAGVCVLTRTKAEPALARLSAEELQTRLLANPDYGFDRFSDTIIESVHQLAENGGWVLDLGNRPDAAIPFLHEMFDETDKKSAEDYQIPRRGTESLGE